MFLVVEGINGEGHVTVICACVIGWATHITVRMRAVVIAYEGGGSVQFVGNYRR